jgi:dsRNA-specific ribonuclease
MASASLEPITGIYLGNRGVAFKKLIEGLLKKGNIKQKYLDILTTPESMDVYASAFTSEQVDENNNYQVYEQLGDLTGNKFIVWYIYKRFPQLKCAEGVKVAARLRINLGSKNSFCSIAEEHGFWDFISATNELRQRKKKPLLEDVFEAFLGATETLLDEHTRVGVGYACVYKILGAIFDEMPISLRYEDLYDAKTRLKELFDIHADKLGPLRYEEKREELVAYSMIYRLDGAKYDTRQDGTVNMNSVIGKYKKVLIGKGSAALKADAEQVAAADALKNLAAQGYIKHAPSIYARFAGTRKEEKRKTDKADVLKMIGSTDKIDEQFFTRGKSKYQSKYTSTALIHYCRKRDLAGIRVCLEMKANPNIPDSEGMTALDTLLIGVNREKVVYRAMTALLEDNESVDIHKNVFQVYYSQYQGVDLDDPDFFTQAAQKMNFLD